MHSPVSDLHAVLRGFLTVALTDPKTFSDLKVTSFTPKTFEADDVEVAITHCGVCGSDVHTLKQGWGETKLPLVVGHEIVGKVTRVGEKVKSIKVGDRVGVGAQIGSCMECRQCKEGFENYCPKMIHTYVSALRPSVYEYWCTDLYGCSTYRTRNIQMVSSRTVDMRPESAHTSSSYSPSPTHSSRATPRQCFALV